MDPLDEPRTVIMNGVVDDRFYQRKEIEQYDEDVANLNELILTTQGDRKTCPLTNLGLSPRKGWL